MQHSVNVSGLNHTIEMTPVEALALIAKLTEAVRFAVGPSRIASHTSHDLSVFNEKANQRLNGTLSLVVRP